MSLHTVQKVRYRIGEVTTLASSTKPAVQLRLVVTSHTQLDSARAKSVLHRLQEIAEHGICTNCSITPVLPVIEVS